MLIIPDRSDPGSRPGSCRFTSILKLLRAPYKLVPLLVAAFLASALAGGPSPLPGPEEAEAAQCRGGSTPPRKATQRRAAKAVLCLVNKQRSKRGIRRLDGSGDLHDAARSHTARMQKSNCFDHTCPGEPSLTGRYQRHDYLPCRCSWGSGENIAWGAGRRGTPARIVKSWMRSRPHREAILERSFEHIGVGVRWGSPKRRKAKAGTYTLDFGYKR